MAGEAQPPPKPPTQNHSTSAVKQSSSHRSNSRLESSTPKATINHKPSTSASTGAQNTNPISSSTGVQQTNPTSSSAAAQKTNPSSTAGAQKTNPTSNNNTSTNTTAKPSPATPKVKPNPSPKPDNLSLRFDPPVSKLPPFPFLDPPPPPAYGFHMLDRGTIVLADGSVRSYFALPRDYQDFPAMPPRPGQGFGFGRPLPMSPEFRGPGVVGERDARFMIEGRGGGPGPGEMSGNFLKRKFGEDEINGRDGYERQRQKLLQYGSVGGSGEGVPGYSSMNIGRGGEQTNSPNYLRNLAGGNFLGHKHNEVDQSALKKAFLHFLKTIYENANQMKMYMADGKHGSLPCLACGRSTKGFSDMHELVIHAYTSENTDSSIDHLGFHKALCILMGWNYRSPPDNSRRYQFLPADEAVANQEDLIMWPPLVIIHNTITGKGSDRMEGMVNKAMDSYLRDLGIRGGKAKPMYSKEGHLGVTLIKFNGDQSGLKEAVQLAEIFAKENHERKAWARVEPHSMAGMYDERNPHLVKVDERTGEKKRIFYGYLATVFDMDRVDFETKKTITIESKRELKLPS